MNSRLNLTLTLCLFVGCTTNTSSDAIIDATIAATDAFVSIGDANLRLDERCNDRDDDGDGKIDEGFGIGTACQSEIGRCLVDGLVECATDEVSQCSAHAHQISDEECNGVDDDCDGQIDEGFEVNVPCTNAPGNCGQVGRSRCSEDRRSIVCDAPTRSPEDERCNGQDDDCDNRIDEDFALTQSCQVGVGACLQSGVIACNENDEAICNAPIISPQDERCNRVDDDCDGVVDESACTQLILDACTPSLIWRTGLQADPLPLSVAQCHEVNVATLNYACETTESNDNFAVIELPFRNDAVILGYGFGIGVWCNDELPGWLSTLVERDCRIYFGFTSANEPPDAQTETLARCPQERFGYTNDFSAGCGSVAFGTGLSGIEFNRALAPGDQIGFGFECRQSINDQENALVRAHLNRELSVEMGWAKSDAPWLDEPASQWFGCAQPANSETSDVQCAHSGPGTIFGLLSIIRPVSPRASTPDIIGIRLRKSETAP